jgi:hypothetical protein
VARLSSAKAPTAVRIRSEPQKPSDYKKSEGFFILQLNNQLNNKLK